VIAQGIGDTVQSGPFILAALLSLAAGVVSFASPCVVPLVPGYLSYIAGLVGAETGTAVAADNGDTAVSTRRRVSKRALLATGLFVLGFSLVFVIQTVAVFGISHLFIDSADTFARIGGVITILMGLVLLGYVGPLQREWRLHLRPTGRIIGAPLLGVAFGLGWVTCIGPVLLSIISVANSTEWNGSAWRGLWLVVIYCIGLGLPFMLLAFGFSWAGTGLAFLKRNSRRIQVIGAIALILLGILMVTGAWTGFINWLQDLYGNTSTVL